MLCSEAERSKIIGEINSISNRVAQEQYAKRIKNIISDVKVKTGQDITSILPSKQR